MARALALMGESGALGFVEAVWANVSEEMANMHTSNRALGEIIVSQDSRDSRGARQGLYRLRMRGRKRNQRSAAKACLTQVSIGWSVSMIVLGKTIASNRAFTLR